MLVDATSQTHVSFAPTATVTFALSPVTPVKKRLDDDTVSPVTEVRTPPRDTSTLYSMSPIEHPRAGPAYAPDSWRPTWRANLEPPLWRPMPVSPTLTNLTNLYRRRVQQRVAASYYFS